MATEEPKSPFQDAWERSPGFVYFIAAGNPPVAIKIGVTKQSEFPHRFRALQGSNHEPLRLLGVIPFDEGERPMKAAELKEAELHQRFTHLRRFEAGWVGSEWFTASPELEEFIGRHSVSPIARGLPEAIARPRSGLPSSK